MRQNGRYHHGDLRVALIREATSLLNEQGIEGLSLRRLAERAGVSRTAPYHHFKDKNALLCALAAQAFGRLDEMIERASLSGQDQEKGLKDFVRDYLRFATENPEQYELMFGRTLWKVGKPTEELREVAYRSFRHYAVRLGELFTNHPLPPNTNPLRLAQASWATLHGLCRLLIDGIYVNREDMEEVSEQAVQLVLSALEMRQP